MEPGQAGRPVQAVAGHQGRVDARTTRSVTLTIRDNAKWSDGQKITADDVAFTFKLLKENEALNTDGHPVRRRSRVSGNTVT